VKALAEQIADLDGVEVYGRVVGVRGLMVEVTGPLYAMSVGARITIETGDRLIPCEVVGFCGANALLMPFAALEGVRRGCRIGSPFAGLARSCGRRHGAADRRQGTIATRSFAGRVPKHAAAGART